MNPRDYQTRDLDNLRAAYRRGKRAPILVAPTGSGKTVTASLMIHGAVQRGLRVAFLAHRRELIAQTSRKLDEIGVDHGVLMGGHWRRRPALPVQVCSVATLLNRHVEPFDLIFIDECHRSVANSYQLILKRFPKAKVVGLTATPIRTDGRGLGELFDEIVMSLTPADLTEQGFLVPCRVYAPSAPDLTGVHSKLGDYDQKELATATDKPKLIGDIVDHYGRLARGRKSVAFATSISHSKHIVDSFRGAGVKADHLDGTTPARERDAIMQRFAEGDVAIVSNVGVWTEGVDVPVMSCAILARPTQSLSLYLQMVGRILRPAPGKTDAIVLDHAGATLQHGFVTDPREWSLDGARKNARKKDKDDEVTVRICLDCYMCYPATLLKCPACGHQNKLRERQIETEEGELKEIAPYTIRKLSKNRHMAKLQQLAAEMGYKPGFVWRNFQEVIAGREPSIPERAREAWERLNAD